MQAGGDARRLPGLHGSGAGGYPGGQEHFSWEGQIWSSSTLNAIAVDLMAARDKHSAVSPPSRNAGHGRAVGEGGSQGERRRREEQAGMWAVGRADGRAGGRVCPPGRCSGRGEGGGPSPAALEATTATAPTRPVTTSSAFSDLGLIFMVRRGDVPPPLTASVIRDRTDV